jgi:phosphate transport system substrate-binding protein
VAQMFSLANEQYTVIVESTGTGNGLQLFCSGNSAKYPDLASASRIIKPSEIKLCNDNGINNILEIKYGYDGIILAHSETDNNINISRKDLFLALVEMVPFEGKLIANPYQKWSDINPELPNMNIELYGPASTSGTRDELNQIVMEDSCKVFPEYKSNLSKCQNIRNDGKYIEIGNNENLIIQKLKKNSHALGIIGYNFYENNLDSLQAVTIDNAIPTINNIRNGKYPLSRALFIYAKTDKNDKVSDGIKLFLETLTSKDMIGKDSYLSTKGLVSLKEVELSKIQNIVAMH